MRLPIYLDNHATTAIDPRVLDAMMPYLTSEYGNAASRNHAFGWQAQAAVEAARTQVADLIGASDKEIIFTSGATESDNLAIKGAVEYHQSKGNHIVTTTVEHKAVLDTCRRLERTHQSYGDELRRLRQLQLAQDDARSTPVPEDDQLIGIWQAHVRHGATVAYVDVEADGRVDPLAISAAITANTVLVSVMLANNEIGTIQPIASIGRVCREKGVLFHCDAVQGLGKTPFDVNDMGVDLVSISAHKMYGPKGVGALYVRGRPRVRIASIIDGGGHERGLRSGTLNVAAIVGFGKACEIARDEMEAEVRTVLALRERLRRGLWERMDMLTLNGSLDHRLPGNLNVSFGSVEAEALMIALKGDIAVSSGSACTAASLEPSYVLRACGVPEQLAFGSIRFGIGRFNTAEEIEYTINVVAKAVPHLRSLQPTT